MDLLSLLIYLRDPGAAPGRRLPLTDEPHATGVPVHDDEREGAQCEQPLPGADEARAGADARLQNGLYSDSQQW